MRINGTIHTSTILKFNHIGQWDPQLYMVINIHDEIGWETDDAMDDWFNHLYDEEADEFKMHEFVDMEDFQR